VNVTVELAVHAAVPFVLGDERSASPAVRLRHELANLRVAILDMTIGIDDFGVFHILSFRVLRDAQTQAKSALSSSILTGHRLSQRA